VCVYIQEAHPSDGWQVLTNLRQGVVYAQPTSEDERAEVAEACVLGLDLKMPMVVDDMSNEVDEAYSALPERLYVIDAEGTIAWRSGPGPWGFDLDGFEAALRAQVERG
jgi:hypothetical protein